MKLMTSFYYKEFYDLIEPNPDTNPDLSTPLPAESFGTLGLGHTFTCGFEIKGDETTAKVSHFHYKGIIPQ